jgi:hypothetical protein
MLGNDDAKPTPEGPPRVLLAVANHARSPGWQRTKVLQREMYDAANGTMQMKFACYGDDNEHGLRKYRITTNWITDADSMDGLMDRSRCSCGCFVNIRSALEQAVKENTERPMRAVIIVGDSFHDDQESLDEAALAANELRRQGTKVFLIQQGANPDTARRLQFLARVTGAAYFKFGEEQDQQYAELLNVVSAYAAGGEDAVKARGGKAAPLLLEYLKQEPMPIIEEVSKVQVRRK